MLLRKPQGKLKAKRVLLDVSIFLSRVDPEIKSEERDSYCTFLKAFWRYFYYNFVLYYSMMYVLYQFVV